MDMLENVQGKLRKAWPRRFAVAQMLGMSEDTLRRIRDGQHNGRIYDPGYSKVKALAEYFRANKK